MIMAITGVDMQLKVKKQSALGTIASGGSGQLLRRVQSTLNLKKDTYQSNEIRSDYQVQDFRHGARKVEGSISGEISAGTYSLLIQSAMRRDFAAVTAITGLSVTIAGSGPTYTITRASGDFLAGNIKAGHVVRLSVGTLNAANINKNLLVISVTATVLTVVVLNGVAMVAEGPIASTTVTVQGKVTFCPQTAHTNDFYTFEHWYPTLSPTASESYWDCKVGGFNISLPPTGIATIEFPIMGLDMLAATSEALTSPTAATSTGVLAAVNGVLRNAAGAIANVTGLTINVTNNNSMAGPVVGLNKYVDIVNGRHMVTGQLTAIFDSVTLRDAFINETELALYAAFTADNTAAASFIAITIDRLKLGAADRDDSEGVKTVTLPFTALLNSPGTTSTDVTTLRVQDSAAP
jgi:hypothetical protein